MQHRWIALTCLALLIAAALPVQAQPNDAPLRVGVVVRVDAPDRLDIDRDLAANALGQIAEHLNGVRGVTLVAHDALVLAQARLGITLDSDSTPRQLQRVAQLLDLDRLIVVEVRISERFKVTISATVYFSATDRTVTVAVRASGPKLDDVLARAIRELVHVLLPAL